MSDIELKDLQEQYRRQNVRFQCVQLACKVPNLGVQEVVDLAASLEAFIFGDETQPGA